MHNNYYFLKHLSTALATKLTGYTLVSCFSQNKEELILEFNNSKDSFFIKASLQPSFCCLSFPASFNRAKKNSIDLFNEIILKKVIGVRQFINERSFVIELVDSFQLLFKMHGNLANIVLLQKNKVVGIFRNQFKEDLTIELEELDRTIDWSVEKFEANYSNLAQTYFTLGKEVCNYLEDSFSKTNSLEEKWKLFQQILKLLDQSNFFIAETKGKIYFSLLPVENELAKITDPILAINDFFFRYTSTQFFSEEKSKSIRSLAESIKRIESYLQKNKLKLTEIIEDAHYQLWADLIMANMHHIKMGMKTVTLTNFYTRKPEEIKLKSELNAQQNAEAFYRKSKNQQIEINKLQESIQAKQKELEVLIKTLHHVSIAQDFKSLRPLIKIEPEKIKADSKKALPYHIFEYHGFQIWVGKNAESNDELTLKNSFKEDLWLHAKDVAGSHVLIKHQSGKNFPKDVIERAAELAAYNSKRKTDSLCPVTFTPKKFVRKRKGDPAGAVVVEKEDVILVTPKL